MNRLIINTANEELFIVLEKHGKTFLNQIISQARHNETMLSVIDEMLNSNGLEIKDIDEFGVVIGPGSFTGIRVGIATIKAFRDGLKKSAKGINNLDYLFALANNQFEGIETVAIKGSNDSYFVAKLIHGILFKYEHNLTTEQLKAVANDKPIGMFKQDDALNCVIVKNDAEIMLKCFEESEDDKLVPVYYQLSQAENEKLRRTAVEIREAVSGDVEAIYEIEKTSILTNVMNEDAIKTCIENENYKTFVATANREIVGFIALQKTDEVNIESIAVKKEWRNLGIATRLIEKAEEFTKDAGLDVLSLEVNFKNITAFLLYEKLGFQERRIRKNYYDDGSDCVEMVKRV